ncbi:MAG: LCP family protein [Candidatus Paceibacterota bacterium]|jgi:LCP family protein required for cell wall assembly
MTTDNNTQDLPVRPQSSEVKAHIKYSRIKRKIFSHVWAVRISIILIFLAILGALSFGGVKLFQSLGIGNIFSLAYNFVIAPTEGLASVNGRTNILVMGKAGGSHEGPDLTDSIFLVSVSLKKPGITIISIPRDLWIPEIRAKINSAYYWGSQNTPYFGNLKSEGGGISFAKSMTEEVVGQKIQYGVVIDFSAFKDIIDALGGIQVNVERSFTDKLYPIAGRENDTCGGDPTFACRYQTITFNAGTQKMDGDTALIFVRSRHAEGTEGTDTARESRQQKVIEAIKNKVMSPKVFLSPRVDVAMLRILRKYVQTDIDGPTGAILARDGLKGDKSIHQYLIPEGLLVNPPISKAYDRQYVFIPKAGSGKWEEINNWVTGVLNSN